MIGRNSDIYVVQNRYAKEPERLLPTDLYDYYLKR